MKWEHGVIIILLLVIAYMTWPKETFVSKAEAVKVAKDVVKKKGNYMDFVARIGTSEISPLQFLKLSES